MSDDRYIKDQSDRYLWISPKGRSHKVSQWGHDKFAKEHFGGYNSSDFMMDDGWIKCGTSCIGDYIFTNKKPTEKRVFIVFNWAKKFGVEEALKLFCERWDI